MANGFFLGGMAEGIQTARENAFRERALGLQEQGLDLQKQKIQADIDLSTKQARRAAAKDLETNIKTVITNTTEMIKQPGVSQASRAKAVAVAEKTVMALNRTLAALSSKDGIVSPDYGPLLHSAIETAVPFATAEEAKAKAAAGQTRATTQAGIDVKTDPANIAAEAAATRATSQATAEGTALGTPDTPKVVTSRDENGNLRTQLVHSKTGAVIKDFGTGPTVQFQPTQLPNAKPKEIEALDNAEIAARNVIDTALVLRRDINEGGPAILSTPGAFAGGVQTIRAAVNGFAQLTGIKLDVFEDGTPTATMNVRGNDILDRIEGAANLNAVTKSAIVNLAFSAAAASGQEGRGVSDRDFDRFVKEIGAGASRPETFTAVLDRFVERIGNNFTNRFNVQKRRIPALKDAAAPNLTDKYFNSIKSQGAGPASPTTVEEFNSLPSGALYVNPADGKIYRKR